MALRLRMTDRPDRPNNSAMRPRVGLHRWLIVFVLLGLLWLPQGMTRAYAAGAFEPQIGPLELVNAVAAQADGKVLLAGSFEIAGQHIGIARLNADGTLDDAFQPSADGTVNAIMPLADGHILVSGSFQHVSGTLRPGLVRLNADGSLDDSFDAMLDGTPLAVALQPDDKILIAGSFRTVGGQMRNNVARINADGTLDTAFNANLSATDRYSGTYIKTIAMQADGKLLIGGLFNLVSRQYRENIARLNGDGSLDTGFNVRTSYTVNSIVVQANDKSLVAGPIWNTDGSRCYGVAQLDADGNPDPAFCAQANGEVNTIAVQADGKVLAGGYFSQIDGQPRSYLARLLNKGA